MLHYLNMKMHVGNNVLIKLVTCIQNETNDLFVQAGADDDRH